MSPAESWNLSAKYTPESPPPLNASLSSLHALCDRVVSDLLALHGSFPGISCKLNPIEGNTFAGSPILPSGASPDLIVGFCC